MREIGLLEAGAVQRARDQRGAIQHGLSSLNVREIGIVCADSSEVRVLEIGSTAVCSVEYRVGELGIAQVETRQPLSREIGLLEVDAVRALVAGR